METGLDQGKAEKKRPEAKKRMSKMLTGGTKVTLFVGIGMQVEHTRRKKGKSRAKGKSSKIWGEKR